MKRINVVRNLVHENGFVWLALFGFEKIVGKTATKWRLDYEMKHLLPGFNTRAYNQKGWTEYDWSNNGDEWNNSNDWKQSIIDLIMKQYIQPGGTILEIGPGSGKWTESLITLADKLILVDLTETVIQICKTKFAHHLNCSFHVNDGQSLSFIEPSSVDYVWTFDVFVHIAPTETAAYLTELSRVLKPGGIAIVHHPKDGGHNGGFRSSVTDQFILDELIKNDLDLITQFSSWGSEGQFTVKAHNDTITIFSKNAKRYNVNSFAVVS